MKSPGTSRLLTSGGMRKHPTEGDENGWENREPGSEWLFLFDIHFNLLIRLKLNHSYALQKLTFAVIGAPPLQYTPGREIDSA